MGTVKRTRKRILGLLAAALLLAVFLFSLPPAAAIADGGPEQVLALLNQLQSADISPGWPPDIQANQALVQTLLDAYLACTPAQQAGFTAAQRDALRAYFETLYSIKGLDPAETDALFGSLAPSAGSSPSHSAPASSSAPAVSSGPPSSALSPAPSVSPALGGASAAAAAPSSPAALPVGVSGAASLPVSAFGPQVPGGGWAAFFANPAPGAGLLLLLLALAGFAFLRFLRALHGAGRAPKASFTDDFRRRELFGENYDPELASRLAADMPCPLPAAPRAGQPRRRAEPPAVAEREGPAGQAAIEPPTLLPRPPAGGTGDLASARPLGRLTRPFGRFAGKRPAPPAPETAPKAGQTAFTGPSDTGGGLGPGGSAGAVRRPRAAPDSPAGAGADSRNKAPQSPPGGTRPATAPPQPYGRRRTGKPAKMTFRQGEPGDLDAIDE